MRESLSAQMTGSAVTALPRAVSQSERKTAAWVLTAVFSATLFVSATLLFTVEPMFAKMVLPRLGGSPAVWNTCVVFFQAVMLAGYAYAHLTSRWLPLGRQAIVHLSLILIATLVLPVAIPSEWVPPVDGTPIPALLVLLLVTLGPPFFVVSSTAPLMQRWFSRADHPAASDPYFLYASSNLGSIAALLAYPFVIEPLWSLSQQSSAWAVTYIVFGAMTLICALAVRSTSLPLRLADASGGHETIVWQRRARWAILAFAPSSLMLGVTTFLSTDVAAMPLLWTIPLALYLLTFVLAFSSRPLIPRQLTSPVAVVLVITTVALNLGGIVQPALAVMPIHLAGFFAISLLLHRELSRDRPSTQNLTEFYLWISIGGLLGGLFNTLVAPAIFSSVLEYPLVLALALGLHRQVRGVVRKGATLVDLGFAVAFGVSVTIFVLALKQGPIGPVAGSVAIGICATLVAACAKHPLRLGAGLVLVVLGVTLLVPRGASALHAERSFYGVLRVARDENTGRHQLFHGSTLHGEQSLNPSNRHQPLTYYHATGPIGQALGLRPHRLENVAVIGLGAGSLAAYATPQQKWTFFEIDPAVARIASDPRWFTYLQVCGERCQIVLGDARLSLAATEATYDMIVLDAFSSDAIPAHLLTREALELYLRRLHPDGSIAIHISNRHLDLRPVVGSLAAEQGLQTRVQVHRPEPWTGAKPSVWIVAARTPDALGLIATDPRWEAVTSRSQRVWSDDYSDILSVLGPAS